MKRAFNNINGTSGRKIAVGGLLAFTLALTACTGGQDENQVAIPDAPSVTQSPEPSVTAVATPSVDASEPSKRVKEEIKEGLDEVNDKPLGIDPSSVKIPDKVKNAFSDGATDTLVMEALKFQQLGDGFNQLQQPGRERSPEDIKYLEQLKPHMTPALYDEAKEQYFTTGTALFPYFQVDDQGNTGVLVDGKRYTPKEGGLHFTYGEPVVTLNTESAPDSAQITNRAILEVPAQEGGIITITALRSYTFIPAPDGEWLMNGYNVSSDISVK